MFKSVFKHTYQTGPKIVKLQNFRGKKIQKRLKIYFGTFLVGYCYPWILSMGKSLSISTLQTLSL